MTENQETLIRNAVSYSAKPYPSSSSKKPKAKSGKKKSKPQETPKKDFHFLHLDPLKMEHLTWDLVPEVEVVAPPREEPLPLRNNDVPTPLPLPLPNIPVGGRLAHFAQNWAEITDDKWVLSLVRKGYRIPFLEHPNLSPNTFSSSSL